MGSDLNRVSEMLGVDARDKNAIRAAAGDASLAELDASFTTKRNRFFTHFNAPTTIPAGLTLTSEGTTTAAATYGIGLGGEATITSDDVAAKTEQLSTQLLWQVNRQIAGQPLVAEFKWKTGATITASEYWVGISDAVADTDPIALSATSTFTTSAPSNGVYMGYSATPTSGGAFTTGGNQHTAISINANTDAVVATGGGIFVAATYYVYRFEVDSDLTCRYYVNGQLLATKASALAGTVPLNIVAWAAPRTTVGAAITIDYMGIDGF